jgi:hypothetical protein
MSVISPKADIQEFVIHHQKKKPRDVTGVALSRALSARVVQ